MKKIGISILLATLYATLHSEQELVKTMKKPEFASQETQVFKKVLKNGMTVLVKPVKTIPKVCVQMWYNVGSKDEMTGEKGIAHLIEHMIFKGTQKLSESDINELVHKLSGTCNAFTSYDYTGYLFNMPSSNWKQIIPVVADCMVNASFKEDHLSSEMKAVIQELKMRRDNYDSSLAWEMISVIFPDHPYHYPIIGYKQDLWNVHGKDLSDFYKKHYIPNNAVLVVVGDVNTEDVFATAEKYFGSIIPNTTYKKDEFYYNEDIASKDITMYRDVAQPTILAAFVVPGTSARQDDSLEILNYLLGHGKTSRLYKKIVEELGLATSIDTFVWNLFEHSVFFIFAQPKKEESIPAIYKAIQDVMSDIVKNGVSHEEIIQAIKQAQMQYYNLLENMEKQAYEIGKYFLATRDENYAFKLFDQPIEGYQHGVVQLCEMYLRQTVMHKGMLLPLPTQERKEWKRLQEESDDLDNKILSARVRATQVEPAKYVLSIKAEKPKPFNFPKAEYFSLSNGADVYVYNNQTVPKITLSIDFKTKYFSDPVDKQGLLNFMSNMLLEGTKKYTASQLAHELESRGISLSVYPGGLEMSMLSSDIETGLTLLKEIVTEATLPEDRIEKVRDEIIADIKNYWDDPKQFIGQIVKEKIYTGTPLSKNSMGTIESIAKITREDLLDCYKKSMSFDQASIAIAGDVHSLDIKGIMQRTIGIVPFSKVTIPDVPKITSVEPIEINYPINRDQTVVCFAGISIERTHPDYDKLLLFEQIFGGGVLGSMASRLFQLREQSGLFYTINGSMISGASEYQGMVIIKTIVSLDRLQEAEQAIRNTINTVVDSITEQELEQAKQAVINNLTNLFETNSLLCQVLQFLHKYKLPADYFDKRAAQLEAVTLQQVKEAAAKILKNDKLMLIKAGREHGK